MGDVPCSVQLVDGGVEQRQFVLWLAEGCFEVGGLSCDEGTYQSHPVFVCVVECVVETLRACAGSVSA